MDRHERITLLHHLFSTHKYGLTVARLLEETGSDRATLYRDLADLQYRHRAPLAHDGKKPRTYFYVNATEEHGTFELPGLWLRAEQIYVLVLAGQMFGGSGAGCLVSEQLKGFQPHLAHIFGQYAEHFSRIRVIRMHARQVADAVFRVVADALLRRRTLGFTYVGRDSGRSSVRRVSPQWLTHYRDNWYLEAWDEDAHGLRMFALECVAAPVTDAVRARDLDLKEWEGPHKPGYGLLSGPVTDTAILRFSVGAGRLVANECWHPDQQQRFLDDGRLELRVPYSQPHELIRDVMRYGADAEVLGPPDLRRQVIERHAAALANYGLAAVAAQS